MIVVVLLGDQSMTDGGPGAVSTRSTHTAALVGFLAVHAGAAQSRQRIAALFWPDSSDAQALTNLRRELHLLRHVLRDDPALVVTSRDLCWQDSPTCEVDVSAFMREREAAVAGADNGDLAGVLRHGKAAIARFRGEFLPGSYADWVLDARSELDRQLVEVCDLVADAAARTGDLAGAVAAARRRIRLRPLEEAGYRALMGLQAQLGDRAGAVSTYHHCASVLERELGIDPDPATRQALENVLSTGGATPEARTASGRRTGLAAGRLVGRERELDLLLTTWRATTTGRPSIVLVRGDAGVGKTRLVTEIADRARADGATVAASQCFGAAGRLALAPVADWLRSPAVQQAGTGLDPVWRTEVERLVPSKLVPSKREPVEVGAGSRAMVDAWQRHRFFEGLARALVGFGRPTLLVLDNLQWCDEETLAFLALCLRLNSAYPLMVAATWRTDAPDPDPATPVWIAGMRSAGVLTDIPLGPLESPETAVLAESVAGRMLSDTDTDLLQATTGGFPLHVVEATRSLVADAARRPGDDLTAVLHARLDQGSPAARDVAALAAAVGKDFTLDLLTEASDLAPDDVVRAVDELWRRRILYDVGDGYDFSHDLLRETAYGRISPANRWLLHRRIALALELAHAEDTDPVSAQLAEQYARGGRAERALGFYLRAAELAAATFAHAEAIRLLSEAVSIIRKLPPGTVRDRHELAALEALAAPLTARYGYSSPKLQQTLERSIELAGALGRRDATTAGLVSLWTCKTVQGHITDAYRVARQALDTVEPGSAGVGAANFAVAGASQFVGRHADALRHFAACDAQVEGTHLLSVGTRPDVHSRAWAAHAHWLIGDADEAQRSARDAVARARLVDHPYSLAVALAYAGITLQMRGDIAELRETVDELRRLCDQYEFAYYREWAPVLDGWATSDVETVKRGIAALRAEGAFARMPYWLTLLSDLHTRAGRPDEARPVLDAALSAATSRNDVWWLPEVMRKRAAHDAPAAAAERVRAAARIAREQGSLALLRRCEHDLDARNGCTSGAFEASE